MAYSNLNGSDMMSAWTQMQAEMQKNLWDGWLDTAKMMSASNPYMNPYLEATEKWRELTEQSLQVWSGDENMAERAMNSAANSTARSAAEGAVAGQNAMMQLMEMSMKAWGDLSPQLGSSNWPQVLERYTREVQEQFLDAATSSVQGTQNAMELWQTYLEEGQKFAQLWSEPFKLSENGAQMSGNLMGLSNLFWDAFDKTLGRYTSSPSLGYARETNQKLLQSFGAWTEVQRASADYSAQMASISAKAFNAIIEEMVSLSQNGENMNNYQALIQRWISVADGVFVEAFRSPEYIRAQGKLLSAGMLYRKREEALQELFLESRGLPTRTEVDETHRDIYELRKELRSLKRELKSLREQKSETPAPTDVSMETPLPEDLPERDFVLAAGIHSLASLPRTVEGLIALSGIGQARAENIMDYLNKKGGADARSRAI